MVQKRWLKSDISLIDALTFVDSSPYSWQLACFWRCNMKCKNCRFWQQQIPAPLALVLTYEKDSSAFTSSPFDFVATGLRAIQFLLLFCTHLIQHEACIKNNPRITLQNQACWGNRAPKPLAVSSWSIEFYWHYQSWLVGETRNVKFECNICNSF
jgi:hypothetical protein